MKNAILYYSNTNECLHIAQYIAKTLNYRLTDITQTEEFEFENAVVVFPVYCQNVPDAVYAFLNKIKVCNIALIAAYGKMSCGNVLYEIQNKFRFKIIAAAYVPTKHSYIDEPVFNDFGKLDAVTEKFLHPDEVKLPKLRKNIFADVLKGLRSRIGIKIIKTDGCDECGLCNSLCVLHAITYGKTNGKCIRCLKCVINCPQKALKTKKSFALSAYLRKKKKNDCILYV